MSVETTVSGECFCIDAKEFKKMTQGNSLQEVQELTMKLLREKIKELTLSWARKMAKARRMDFEKWSLGYRVQVSLQNGKDVHERPAILITLEEEPW